MIPGNLLSAFPHRQFHTLPGLLDSWAALPNSNPNACMPMQGGSSYHCYDGLWYDPAERRTHDLLCERGTRYRLSQPDTVHPVTVYRHRFSQSLCPLMLNTDALHIPLSHCFIVHGLMRCIQFYLNVRPFSTNLGKIQLFLQLAIFLQII